MTSVIVDQITPSGVPERDRPAVGTQTAHIRYRHATHETYVVKIQRAAPHSIRVSIELGREAEGVWAHIPELDVSAEGASVSEAFRNVLSAAREWLTYLDEEGPELAPDLAGQERYKALLHAPVFSWFKSFRFAD